MSHISMGHVTPFNTSRTSKITSREHIFIIHCSHNARFLICKCCSVLPCVAVCCSLLQCVPLCCSVLQCVAACCIMLQRVAVCCSVLQSDLPIKSDPESISSSYTAVMTHESRAHSTSKRNWDSRTVHVGLFLF